MAWLAGKGELIMKLSDIFAMSEEQKIEGTLLEFFVLYN